MHKKTRRLKSLVTLVFKKSSGRLVSTPVRRPKGGIERVIVDFGWNSSDTCAPEVMNRCARVVCEQPPGNPAREDSLVTQKAEDPEPVHPGLGFWG